MPREEMSPRLRSYELLLCHSAGFIDSQSNREDKSTPASTHPPTAALDGEAPAACDGGRLSGQPGEPGRTAQVSWRWR